ncbi:hypothetical protein C8R44DRAFT_24003 [Mycena epipterygia]|nr:hypothetical protein C8R44DRAFT_24003 [Mycena epipterygia]
MWTRRGREAYACSSLHDVSPCQSLDSATICIDLFSQYNHFAKIFAAIARWLSSAFSAVIAWVKHAFAAAVDWTRDTLPIVYAWLLDAAATASQPVKAHRHAVLLASALIFLGPQIILLPLLILQAVFFMLLAVVGFGVNGIVGGALHILSHCRLAHNVCTGSLAARYQSLCYGGNTPASSIFAIFQSIGMKYHAVTLSHWVLAIIRLLAGFLFVYVVLGMTWLW